MEELFKDMQNKKLVDTQLVHNFNEFITLMLVPDCPYLFKFGGLIQVWFFDTIPDNSKPTISLN